MKQIHALTGFGIFLAIFLAQAAHLASTNSTISDEVAHIGAGYTYVKYHDFRLNMEHPPLTKQMAAVPLLFMKLKFPEEIPAWKDGDGEQWEVGRSFLYKSGNPAEKMITAARLALLPVAVLFAAALFFWVRTLLGDAAAVFSVFLFAFIPDMVSHSSLVTSDFAGAAFHFLTFYFLCGYHQSGKRLFLLGAGVAGGLAVLSKFSMMQILPLFYFFAFLTAFYGRRDAAAFRFPILLLLLMIIPVVTHKIAIQIFALPLLFMILHRFFPNLKIFSNEKINRGMAVTLALLAIAFLIVALFYFEPQYWFEKFRPFRRFFRGWAIFRDHAVKLQHPGYLFGQYSTLGWQKYYLVAMLVKIPVAVWIFAAAGFLAALVKKYFTKIQWLYLTLPPLFFLFIASVINKVNIGVRHVLPVYPYVLVFAAAGFYFLWNLKNRVLSRCTALILSGWLVLSSLSAFPNYLSYFNELAQIWGGGENILSDSNISWGQDLRRLKKFVEENRIPEIRTILLFNFPDELNYYKIPWKEGLEDFKMQRPGIYALDVYIYQKLVHQDGFEWLRSRKPDRKVGGSLWVYRF